MKLDNLHNLFILELQNLYDAENQITQSLPQLLEIVQSDDLRGGMQKHLEETKIQIQRLEQIGSDLGIELSGRSCMGMEGIIEEGISLLQEEVTQSPTLDAAIIATLQKVEHYEIAGYGTAAAYAKEMGHDKALELLLETLSEEKNEDEALSSLAEGMINEEAAPHHASV